MDPQDPHHHQGAIGPTAQDWLLEQQRQQQQTNETILQQLAALTVRLDQPAPSAPSVQSLPVMTPSVPAPSDTLQSRPKHLLPRPTYDDLDRALFAQFRGTLWTKVYGIDQLACGNTEQERVWYGFACLVGKAAARVYPWIEFTQRSGSLTLLGFFGQLDSAFSDPQKIKKAIAQLNSSRQGNTSFRDYHFQFEQALLTANGFAWDDAVKKGYLSSGLSIEMKTALVSQCEPDTYVEYVQQLQETADRLEALRKDPRTYRQNQQLVQPPQQSSSAMEWERIGRAPFVDSKIQQQRRERGACIKCGLLNHFARDCRTGWKLDKRTSRVRSVSRNTVTIRKADSSAPTGTASDSGKE